jgi:hypothetical protein
MTGSLKEYADLYRLPGPWCTAYVDAGTGTVDSLEAADVRPGNVRAQLEAQGASAASTIPRTSGDGMRTKSPVKSIGSSRQVEPA